MKSIKHLALLLPAMLLSAGVSAQEINGADTAWILTSTALVLFMTIPGLSLFYAGLVRSKNVLSVLMQCFALTCLMSLVWFAVGYTIAFGSEGVEQGKWIGDFGNIFFANIGMDSVTGTVPSTLFAIFPDDVRNHHTGADRGWFCRANALFSYVVVQHFVADSRLFASMPLGLGWRLAGSDGFAGFCRWHCSAHHRGSCRAGRRHNDGAAPGFWHRGYATP